MDALTAARWRVRIPLRRRGLPSGSPLPLNCLLMTAGQLEAADARLPACWAGLLAS